MGEPMPNVPEMGAFWSSMAAALTNITSGRQDVDAALTMPPSASPVEPAGRRLARRRTMLRSQRFRSRECPCRAAQPSHDPYDLPACPAPRPTACAGWRG